MMEKITEKKIKETVVHKIIVPFASDGVTHPAQTEFDLIHYSNGYIVTSIGMMSFETYDRIVETTVTYDNLPI